MNRRHRGVTAALACVAALVTAQAAQADSISYVKDGNVWLSTPDGARQVQVTTAGGYTYASQADDGTLVALVGQRLQKLSPTGQVLADFATPVTDPRTDGKQFFGPFDPVVSPDGTRVAYGYYYQYYGFDPTCNYPVGCIREHLYVGTGLTAADRLTSWDEPGFRNQTGWRHPAWNDNATLMLSEPAEILNEDVIIDTAGDDPQVITRWFVDESLKHLKDGEMNRQHTMMAFVGGDESDTKLRIYRLNGEPKSLPDACYEFTSDDGTAFASPSWSPDGTRLAFAKPNGITVAAIPDLAAGCAVGTDGGTLVIPGASAPDWGPANVPVKTAPPVTDPGNGPGSGPGTGPGGGGGADLDVRVALHRKPRLAAVLKTGLPLWVSASEDRRTTVVVSVAKALRTRLKLPVTLGTGVVKATSGGAPVKVRFTPATVRKLKGLKAVTFAVAIKVGGKLVDTQTVRVVR